MAIEYYSPIVVKNVSNEYNLTIQNIDITELFTKPIFVFNKDYEDNYTKIYSYGFDCYYELNDGSIYQTKLDHGGIHCGHYNDQLNEDYLINFDCNGLGFENPDKSFYLEAQDPDSSRQYNNLIIEYYNNNNNQQIFINSEKDTSSNGVVMLGNKATIDSNKYCFFDLYCDTDYSYIDSSTTINKTNGTAAILSNIGNRIENINSRLNIMSGEIFLMQSNADSNKKLTNCFYYLTFNNTFYTSGDKNTQIDNTNIYLSPYGFCPQLQTNNEQVLDGNKDTPSIKYTIQDNKMTISILNLQCAFPSEHKNIIFGIQLDDEVYRGMTKYNKSDFYLGSIMLKNNSANAKDSSGKAMSFSVKLQKGTPNNFLYLLYGKEGDNNYSKAQTYNERDKAFLQLIPEKGNLLNTNDSLFAGRPNYTFIITGNANTNIIS